MRSTADKAMSWATTVALGLFFFWALLYPLSHGLLDAVREPVTQLPQKGETWPAFAERVGTAEEKLRTLNGIPAADKAPAENRPVIVGHTYTFRHILRVFDPDAMQIRWLVNSLMLAVVVTLASAAIAYPLAYLQARTTFWKQGLLAGLLLLPLVMPPFVGAIGLRRMLSKYGTFNLLLMEAGIIDRSSPIDFLDNFRFFGCAVVMVLHFYPLLYLNLTASISNIDPSLLESSRSLGMTPWQTFKRVVFPLSTPGLIAGGSLVFIGAFMDLGTPLIFGYQETVARKIYSLANEQTNNPAAPALVAVVTVLVLILFALTRWSLAKSGQSMGTGVKGQTRVAGKPLAPKWSALAIGLHLVVVAFAVIPHFAVILAGFGDGWFGDSPFPASLSLRNMSEALGQNSAAMAMRNSLLYAFASTAIDLALGLACAWVIVRRGGWWGRALDALSLAPLAVPGLVLAFGYVGAYAGLYTNKNTFWGELGVGFFLILSYSIRRLPYTVRACTAGLEQTPRNLEEAAGNLGAKPWAVIRKITLPLISANVVAGGILAFSFAMLEVSDSLVLAQRPQDAPLTKAIFGLFSNPGNGDQLASALGVVALVFLSFSLLAAGSVLGRKWGEMFRG